MKAFELHDARSVGEAVALLDQYGPTARVVAGGSDLVSGQMKDWVQGKGLPYPEHLVDVMAIPEMQGIRVGSGGAAIGAATPLTDVIESAELRRGWPVLVAAAESVASPLIRNFGTLGGNINQRPRCWFFRGEGFDCYKKGGDFCFAVTGDNRFHAVIGGELCYIVHPSDTATALLALNAAAKIAGPGGERIVPFDEYFIGPRQDVLRENVLRHNDVLVEVQLPPLAASTRTAWTKLKDRQVYDFAVVSVAAVVTAENGVWRDGRIVLGGVAPVPYRAKVVEDALVGKPIGDNLEAAAARIRTVARPLSLNAYKVDLAQGLIQRTVREALA
jgi:xanthine dehydrogenase YagS FAD-binding subunit